MKFALDQSLGCVAIKKKINILKLKNSSKYISVE